MKKLIYLLLALPFLFTACTDIDPAETAPELLSIQASEIEPTSVILTCKTGNGNTSWGHVIVKTDDEEEWREFGVWGSEEYDDDFIHGNRTYTTEAYGLKPGTTYRAVFCYSLESYLRTGIGAETTFTTEGVSYKVVTTEPTEVSTNSAFLTGYTEFSPNEVKNGEIYFKIAWDANFEDYETVRAKWSGDVADDRYYFYLQVNFLNPGRTYWVQAIMTHHTWGTDDAVMGNVISFTTPDLPKLSLYGEGITYDGVEISEAFMTDVVNIYIQDQDTKTWLAPAKGVYNYDTKKFELDPYDYAFNPDHGYFVVALSGTDIIFDNSGYVIFGEDDYTNGRSQNTIYYAMTDFSGRNPEFSLNMNPWTSFIAIEYPVEWGEPEESVVRLKTSKQVIGGNDWDLASLGKPLGYTDQYSGIISATISADSKYYRYVFNIWPGTINGVYDPTATLYLKSGPVFLHMPTLELETGRGVTVRFNGLGVEDTTIIPWAPQEGGTVTIRP